MYVYARDTNPPTAVKMADADARAGGRLVVDLSDGWAPFIFQDTDGPAGTTTGTPPRPNAYRQTFVDLANNRIDADGTRLEPGHVDDNFLEPFGIPPTLSVLRARVEQDATPQRRECEAHVDTDGLRTFVGNIAYLDREHARREFAEAVRDSHWLDSEIAQREAAAASARARDGGGASDAGTPSTIPATWKVGDRAAALAVLRADPNQKLRARVERAIRGQDRMRAVRAAQARLACDGLLSARSRFTPGMFDLPTHEALAQWERKNDMFGWAALGGETVAALMRPALDLDFDTLRRILAERIADAAGIVEDGSTAKWKVPPTYADVDVGDGGVAPVSHPVPNLIDDHVSLLLASLHVSTVDDMLDFLEQHGPGGLATLRVAFAPPPLPPYYGPRMDLSVEIDRGDVWYDFPFDAHGRAREQPREHFPHLTLVVHWRGQNIPLCSWRTTIGSWRSELHANGKIYYKYKNSDVGPRLWKNIVAGPVWIPPDATPAKDLLTRKVLDREKGPELVVNTAVMGPGFQSAYGLAMAIHIDQRGFDNQIRTHGSVDYTSIARRFSHGCHRLVNNRAVRMFDFVLRRQPFRRIGSVPLALKRELLVDGQHYAFELKTRGYYYELLHPIPITVSEGRIMGAVKAPVAAYVRKVGVDYRDVDISSEIRGEGLLASPDSAASVAIPKNSASPEPASPESASPESE